MENTILMLESRVITRDGRYAEVADVPISEVDRIRESGVNKRWTASPRPGRQKHPISPAANGIN
ncbi:hypothetical protein J6590_019745 [Homalodisca vitripennis]|nr:hypothetical protein J6590_019745 [Homalodisca vitripennis]